MLARSDVLPSLPTRTAIRSSSSAKPEASSTVSLNAPAISPETPVRSLGRRAAKSPFLSALRELSRSLASMVSAWPIGVADASSSATRWRVSANASISSLFVLLSSLILRTSTVGPDSIDRDKSLSAATGVRSSSRVRPAIHVHHEFPWLTGEERAQSVDMASSFPLPTATLNKA